MSSNKPISNPNTDAQTAAEAPKPAEASSPAQTQPPPPAKPAQPNDNHHREDEYKVGYGHPPKNTQFKKGQPSPRKGKKLNKQNYEDMFWKIANEKINAKMGGRTVQMTRYEACLRKRMELAMSGDARAQKEVLGLYSVMSATKRGEEIRKAQKLMRAQMEAMLAEQEEKERQEAEAQKVQKNDDQLTEAKDDKKPTKQDKPWQP